MMRRERPVGLVEVKVMTLAETLSAVSPPLTIVDGDTLRVGNTRIPLERVIYAFNHGCAPEEIVHKYPTLDLADVYAVIAYYLRHREAVDEYVREREVEADEIERQIRAESHDDGLRERLLTRRAQKP
jgi:uncharacterized protein (DUF433 family)